jgi:predicted RNA-binding Zn-ribbon protein involved in translation (DUF1610 family)
VTMSNSHSTSFNCPNCSAKYEIGRVEAPQGATTDREITCVDCGGPLHGREGPFLSSISWLNGQSDGPLAVAEPQTSTGGLHGSVGLRIGGVDYVSSYFHTDSP